MYKYLLLFALVLCFGNITKAQNSNTDSLTNKEEVLTFAEQMPEYPGGMDEMYKFLSKTIQYPAKMREKGIEGRVILTFLVNSDGSISDIYCVNQAEPLFVNEAIRVVNLMPNWKPGRQNNKNVTVKFTLPLKFQLK